MVFSILMDRARQESSLRQSVTFLIRSQLWAQILLGMILGTITGLLLSPGGFALIDGAAAGVAAGWIALPGLVFLELLKMIVIPLIVCSIVLGILTSGSMEELKQMGMRLVPYFMITALITIIVGLALASIIQPGHAISDSVSTLAANMAASSDMKTLEDLTVPQRIVNLIPTNFIEAAMQMDMLKIVIGAIILGAAALAIPRETVKPFEALCEFGQVVSMKIISWAMLLAPYAVFGLMVDAMVRIGFDALAAIGWYVICVLLGLAFVFAMYMAIVKFIAGQSPAAFVLSIRDVMLLAFSTSSSAAVMPLSMRAAEENLGVPRDISRFVIPLGATINMDGTAIYQAIAAVFLCQIFGVDLSFGEMTLLALTTLGASLGTPATPGVGIVVLATILSSIGVPPSGIGIIMGVDRILDMCRTTINVTGDLVACVVMEKWMAIKAA